jgi:hypothetical protein
VLIKKNLKLLIGGEEIFSETLIRIIIRKEMTAKYIPGIRTASQVRISSALQSKNTEFKAYETIILPTILHSTVSVI